MKLTSLHIENFMSVGVVDTHLNDRGLLLIKGDNQDAGAFASNGSGKSTVFSESIVWVLFGETLRGYKGDDVVNREAKKNTVVSLGILDDNGDEYLIERYRKHKEFKNAVRLFKNGKNITAKSDTDTTKVIEELLQIDYMSFTNSILFGQGVSKKFANSNDGDQKKILERMLQIDIFRRCQEVAKERTTKLNTQISSIAKDIQSCDTQIAQQESTLQDLMAKEALLGENVKARIEILESKKKECQEELLELPDTTELRKEYEELKLLKNSYHKRLVGFDKAEKEKISVSADIKSHLRDISRLEAEMDRDAQKMDDIKKGIGIPDTCSECGQKLPKKDTSHIISHLSKKILDTDSKIAKIEDILEDLQVRLGEVNEKLSGKEPLEKLRDELTQQLVSTEAEFRVIDTKATSIDLRILQIEDEIQKEKKSLEITYVDLINKSKELIEELGSKMKKLEEERKGLEDLLEKNNFWVDAYGNQGIKSALLDSVVPFLNQRANHYLGKLTDSTMELKFSTQTTLKNGDKREKFSVDIQNKTGDGKYIGNSGGEKRRIDIAINMALQDLVQSRSNKRIDLIVYDEMYEALDSVGCEIAIELLQEKAQQCGTVLVITHNSDLAELINDTITISKVNGKTTLIETQD